MPTQAQAAKLAATAAAFGLPVTAALPAPKPAKASAKGKAAPVANRNAKRNATNAAARALPMPAAFVPGPAKYGKKNWTGYMVAVTLKGGTPAAANKLHKARAAKAGYNPNKPLDFKWLLVKGYIAPVA